MRSNVETRMCKACNAILSLLERVRLELRNTVILAEANWVRCE